jgi:hypothetical protein
VVARPAEVLEVMFLETHGRSIGYTPLELKSR